MGRDYEYEQRKRELAADFTDKECWHNDFFVKRKILHYACGSGKDANVSCDKVDILVDPDTGVNYFAPWSGRDGYLGFYPRFNADGTLMVTKDVDALRVPQVEPVPSMGDDEPRNFVSI